MLQTIDWMRAWPALLAVAYLLAVAVPLTRVDLRERRLPNRMVLPAFPIALVGQVAATILGSDWLRLVTAVVASLLLLGAGVFASARFEFGMGDVKLIAAIALALGWFNPLLPLVALLLASVGASAWVGAKVLFAGASLQSSIALGPYLLLGYAVSVSGLFLPMGEGV